MKSRDAPSRSARRADGRSRWLSSVTTAASRPGRISRPAASDAACSHSASPWSPRHTVRRRQSHRRAPRAAAMRVERPATPAGAEWRDPSPPMRSTSPVSSAEMTLAEKIGQMTLIEKGSIGATASGTPQPAGPEQRRRAPAENTPASWHAMVTAYQPAAVETRSGSDPLGMDAVHGHDDVAGATIFPHDIGLGAIERPGACREGRPGDGVEPASDRDPRDCAPVVAVPRTIRWSKHQRVAARTNLARRGARRPVHRAVFRAPTSRPSRRSRQRRSTSLATVAPMGLLRPSEYRIDQGVTAGDEELIRSVHLPPYKAAISAGAGSSWRRFPRPRLAARLPAITTG